MKFRILIFTLVVGVLCSFRPGSGPVMTFDDARHNFGFIRQGEIVTHEYTFTNTGDAPLIISDCEVTCKCTTVDFPREPIPKNGTGIIKVTFDSKSAMDRQEREVVVKSNASNAPVTLTFKCVVLKPKN